MRSCRSNILSFIRCLVVWDLRVGLFEFSRAISKGKTPVSQWRSKSGRKNAVDLSKWKKFFYQL